MDQISDQAQAPGGDKDVIVMGAPSAGDHPYPCSIAR
jgi:hypothetical protein